MPSCGTPVRARWFSMPFAIAARISRSSGRSAARGWSVRSSTQAAFLPRSSFVTRSLGKGRNIVRFSTPTLDAPRLAQVIDDRLRVGDQRALPDDHVLGVLEAVADRAGVLPPGERGVLREGAIGQARDVVEVEGPLGRDALRVAVLVLHHAEHGGIVVVEELGDPAPRLSEDHLLRRRR